MFTERVLEFYELLDTSNSSDNSLKNSSHFCLGRIKGSEARNTS